MATRALEVVITGDSRKFSASVKGADRDLNRLEQSGKKTLGSLKTGMLAVGAAATAGLAVGLKKSAEAAIEAEKANARLQSQLAALGIRYSEHEKQIQKVIDKHSQLSGFDDEDLGDSFTNIVRIVGDVNKALDLNTLAMDFARAKHMDVAKAGELVGKVAGGNTGILSRYGIQIEKGATATEALGVLQQKFAGQAKAYGETTAGAVDRSQVAFENLGETIGAHVTPILGRVAEGFSELVRQITTGEGPGGRIRDLFTGIGNTARTAYEGIRGLVQGFRDGEGGARLLAGALGGVAAGFVAFKTIGAVTAGVIALRGAWAGLTAAIAANPIGAIAVGVAAVVGALGIMSIRTSEAEISSREFTDALRAQADALRAVRDIDIDVAQRKANVKSATVAVEAAEKRLRDLRRDGNATALELTQAEADLGQAKVSQRRANRELARSEEDSIRKKEDAQEATRKLTEEERKLNSRINDQIRDREKEIRGIGESIQAVKDQGVNNDATRRTVEKLHDRQRDLRNEINRLKSKEVDVSVKFKLSPAAGSSWGASGDGWGKPVRASLGKLAQGAVNSGALFGAGSLGGFGTAAGGAALKGARAAMAPFAAIGSRFGLSVTSGARPGSITNAGNTSWHSTGEAVDISGGTPNMLAFARAVASMFGGRLAELIHTPMGFSIKNGQRVPPYAAADHYDHVHIAMDTGAPGQGDGWGRRGPRKPRTGDGLGKFNSTAYGPPWNAMNGSGVTATGVDLRPAKQAYGIAVDPGRLKLGRNYYVWPNPFGRKGPFKAFDTGGAIKGNRLDFYDWRGRRSQLAWGKRAVTVSSDPGLNYSGGQNTSGGAPGASGGGGGAANPNLSFGTARSGYGGPNRAGGEGKLNDGDQTDTRNITGPGGAGGYELGVLRAQRGQSRATARDDLSGLIKTMTSERALKRRRLKLITRVLKGRISYKRRVRLVQEQTRLIDEIGTLTESLKEYKADQKGGATTITAAENLEAGVDTSAADTGGGGDTGAGTVEADPNIAILAGYTRELVENQRRIIALTTTQPDQIFAAFAAALDGRLGGPVGLGFQSVGSAGNVGGW
jgi:3D (Asp-Asp-Asp) domain-containing protein